MQGVRLGVLGAVPAAPTFRVMTSSSATRALPVQVADLMDRLTTGLGFTPRLTVSGSHWHIEAANDRARVTFDWRSTRWGIRQTRSTLTVEGRPHALAADIDELASYFATTTPATPGTGAAATGAGAGAVGVEPVVLEPLPPGFVLPAVASAILAQLRHHPELTTRTGMVGTAMSMTIQAPGHGMLRLTLARPRRRWGITSIRVTDARGIDLGEVPGADLAEALRLLTATPAVDMPAAPSIRGTQSVQANKGVEVRKTTVIRV